MVTNRHGQYRLITVSRPTITGEMYGILTTLLAGRGSQLTPIAAPIAFVPMRMRAMPDASGRMLGHGQPCYDAYREIVQRTVDEPFAMFLPG